MPFVWRRDSPTVIMVVGVLCVDAWLVPPFHPLRGNEQPFLMSKQSIQEKLFPRDATVPAYYPAGKRSLSWHSSAPPLSLGSDPFDSALTRS